MVTYLPLLVVLILEVTAAGLFLLRLFRPRFGYSWLIAVFGALLAWGAAWYSREAIGVVLPVMGWNPVAMFMDSPVIWFDEISWTYTLALATLALAVILTDVVRAAESDWFAWVGSLGLVGIGILTITAGNPLSMLLAWTAIDLVELALMLWHIRPIEGRNRIVLAFASRVGGSFLLLIASLVAIHDGNRLTFEQIPQTVVIYLLLAAGLRLGIIPVHLPLMGELALRRGLGTIVRLVPSAASLVLLVRTAQAGVPAQQVGLLLGLSAVAAYVSVYFWLNARDELEGRPFWIIGMASLSLAAAVQSAPGASLAWGLAMLYGGGVLFLYSTRHRWLHPIMILALLGCSALPLTPAWGGALMYQQPRSWIVYLFILPHLLLLAGYLRHVLRSSSAVEGAERWVWLIYPAGLLVIPGVHYLTSWLQRWYTPAAEQLWSLPVLIASGLSTGLALLAWGRGQRSTQLPQRVRRFLRSILALEWAYRLVWRGYRLVDRVVDFFSELLEGEGGLLWAFLIIILFLAILAQGPAGGS